MKLRSRVLIAAFLVINGAWVGWHFVLAAPAVHAQEAQQAQPQQEQTPAQPVEASLPVIKAETRLVLVDTVVTDKKGNYIRDLTQKDFRVWEDNKEQQVKSFSFEADSASPSNSQT